MRIGIALASLALAAGGLATSAQAATIVGSVALGAGALGNGTDLNGSTSFTFNTRGVANTANINTTANDYTAILAGVASSTTGTLSTTIGSTFTLSLDGGMFTGRVLTATRDGISPSETLAVTLLGTVTGVPGFSDTPTSLSITFTQDTPTAVIAAGFSLQSPPSLVPEPASLAMAGLGLAGIAGIGLKARRKANLGA